MLKNFCYSFNIFFKLAFVLCIREIYIYFYLFFRFIRSGIILSYTICILYLYKTILLPSIYLNRGLDGNIFPHNNNNTNNNNPKFMIISSYCIILMVIHMYFSDIKYNISFLAYKYISLMRGWTL